MNRNLAGGRGRTEPVFPLAAYVRAYHNCWVAIIYEWRGDFENEGVNALHAEGFGHRPASIDWYTRVRQHSLGWVCARQEGELVGFVNVAWDGGGHAFILDTVVSANLQRGGVGTKLVGTAAKHARLAGCKWLHADFEDHLAAFYFQACGFTPTSAGLIALDGAAA